MDILYIFIKLIRYKLIYKYKHHNFLNINILSIIFLEI